LLAWAALKLVVEDFPTSPPALLFVALAMYGGALIAGPRIARMPPPVERAGEPARAERQHVS
jgi:hypothetical protein